jgi:hypothetical protein
MSPTGKKGSANNNKHKTIGNDDNQTLYATARDGLRNSHGQGVTAAAVLVAKPPLQSAFLLRDNLQRKK